MKRFALGIVLLAAIPIIAVVSIKPSEALADTPPSTAAPAAMPQVEPIIPFQPINPSQHVIFVLGAGAERAVRGKLIAWLVGYLQDFELKNDAWLIPEPDWTPSDYVRHCQSNYKFTDGAFVVNLAGALSAIYTDPLRHRAVTQLDGNVFYASCVGPPVEAVTPVAAPSPSTKTWDCRYAQQKQTDLTIPPLTEKFPSISRRVWSCTKLPSPQPTPKVTYAYVWSSEMEGGEGWKITYTPFPVLSGLLALASAFQTFVPSKTATSVTTTNFPTPQPVPATGAVSSKVFTSSSTSNAAASALGSLATGILSQSLIYTSTVTAVPSEDQRTWDAANFVVWNAVTEMGCHLKPGAKYTLPPRSDVAKTRPAPFCK